MSKVGKAFTVGDHCPAAVSEEHKKSLEKIVLT